MNTRSATPAKFASKFSAAAIARQAAAALAAYKDIVAALNPQGQRKRFYNEPRKTIDRDLESVRDMIDLDVRGSHLNQILLHTVEDFRKYDCEPGYIKAMRLLIAAGARIEYSNKAVETFSLLAQVGRLDVVRLLLDNGADENVLHDVHKETLARYDLQVERWRKVLGRDPLPELWQEDPALFNGACYEAVLGMLAEDGASSRRGSAVLAFHTAALFQSKARVLKYLKRWGQPGANPLYNVVRTIRVPSAPSGTNGDKKQNLKNWGNAVLKYGPPMARLVQFADKVPSPLKAGRAWSLVKTREECARVGFARAHENLALAKLCFEHNADEKTFNQACEIVQSKRPVTKNIPDIALNGETFGMPQGRFRRLEDGDIKGLFLDKMTDSWQSAGQSVQHGFGSENGGFYVVEDAGKQIVGHSWAWRGKEGELCLDSLETKGQSVTENQWLGIIASFRTALSASNDHNVTALTVGIAGGTKRSCPLLAIFSEAANAMPKDYSGGSRASYWQRLLWRAPHV